MEVSHFEGAERSAKKPTRTPVCRVVSTEWQQFTILSRCFFGQKIHWYKGRSMECFEDSKKCQMCVDSIPQKTKWYIHAVNWHKNELTFVELTEIAANNLDRLCPKDRDLRGLIVRISKTKGGAKGRYLFEILPREIPEIELCPAEDPRETLRFLWDCKNQFVKES